MDGVDLRECVLVCVHVYGLMCEGCVGIWVRMEGTLGYVNDFMNVYVCVRLCSDYVLKLILN